MVTPNQFNQTPVKGQVDLQTSPNTIPCKVLSTEAAPLVPGQSVKIAATSSGGVPVVTAATAADDVIFGFVNYDFKDENFPALSAVEISSDLNVMHMESSAATPAGIEVMVDGPGTVNQIEEAGDGDTVIGILLEESTAANQLVRVLIKIKHIALA